MDIEKMKERIRKLLAKADNTACTVAEAEAFNAKAHALMAEYNLGRADVAAKEAEILRTHKELQVLKRPWSSNILHGLCKLYYCKWFFTRNGRTGTITIVGEESNVAVCHAVAVAVLRAVQYEARITGLGRSFMTGASNSIYQRCAEMRPTNQLAGKTTGTALMVLDNSETQANAAYIEALVGGKLRQTKSKPRINSSEGFMRGSAFGNSVNLQGNLLGKS